MKIEPIKKWTGFRDWLAWKIVDLGRRISPENENAKAFLVEKIMESQLEMMKYGTSEIEIKVKKHK